MPPKNAKQRKSNIGASDGTATPQTPTLSESMSYLHSPRPFKNPNYTKNINRRTKNLKTVLTQERERERAERERRRQEKEERMEVDGEASTVAPEEEEEMPTYSSIEAAPSILPPKHLCDVTGLEAPYTDPVTNVRYHDKSVYEMIKGFNSSLAKEYLAARGVIPVVK